jgi:hypothetical protein
MTTSDAVKYGSGAATVGNNLNIYTNGWADNQYVPALQLGKRAEFVGHSALGLSVGLDTYAVLNNQISP